MKKIFKILLGSILALTLFVAALVYFKVLWILAPYYDLESQVVLEVPVMDMNAYEEIIDTHRRPYIYQVKDSGGGSALICGVSHTKDVNNPELDALREKWKAFNPDIALVEGRVGNLFTWFQDPVEELGEGGLVTAMANRKGIDLYSWEPRREYELDILIKEFSAEELAMFYTFRPYFGNMRYGKYDDPEAALQDYLDSRTDYPQIEGVFESWEEMDAKWKKDFPGIEWRDYGAGKGYPEGYLHEIWNRSNLIRDEHMLMATVELVRKGHRVFVTMGASHAPRIEKCLKAALTGN